MDEKMIVIIKMWQEDKENSLFKKEDKPISCPLISKDEVKYVQNIMNIDIFQIMANFGEALAFKEKDNLLRKMQMYYQYISNIEK